ncbi:conserved hypothetical protein [uncultured Desulfobacterium sp.]|uniref:VWFA domain-containing protein n=1 Tax=uncultured Desulfobacterium sp. TaxID=201089 RepID=A0A445MXF9_9BACT|nr:conserved hypothetical protein [uncultured Desulfobacterium sp.]
MNSTDAKNEPTPLSFHVARKESFIENILLFCRVLKSLRINITIGRVLDVFRSMELINISDKEVLYFTLRANLISEYFQIPIFDRVFQVFWLFFQQSHNCDDASGPQEGLEGIIEHLECFSDDWDRGQSEDHEDQMEGRKICLYSPVENLATKDFSQFTDEDVERIKEELSRIVKKIATKKSRRRHVDPKGQSLSLRHTLRKSMKYGGEIFELATTKKKIKKIKLIALADVSGSMDCYSNFFVQFIYGLQQRLRGVETFVFSTRLSRITDLLKTRSLDEALRVVSETVRHWSGGTNIGSCLQSFNNDYAPSILDPKSVLIIISDGWDRGDTGLLEKEMKRLKESCLGIIWLNPLLSNPNYQPLCKGIHAVMPYLSCFLPFYNLNSIRKLGRTLGGPLSSVQ